MVQITFTLLSQLGSQRTEWEAGQEYKLFIGSYDPENFATAQAWAHSSIGQLSSSANVPRSESPCPNAFFSQSESSYHLFNWTAPATDDEECVIFSVALADGANVAYKTNTVRSCRWLDAGPGMDPILDSTLQ